MVKALTLQPGHCTDIPSDVTVAKNASAVYTWSCHTSWSCHTTWQCVPLVMRALGMPISLTLLCSIHISIHLHVLVENVNMTPLEVTATLCMSPTSMHGSRPWMPRRPCNTVCMLCRLVGRTTWGGTTYWRAPTLTSCIPLYWMS